MATLTEAGRPELALGPGAVRSTFDERLAALRRRRRSQSARVAVQVLSWIAGGLGLVLLAVLIEIGH